MYASQGYGVIRTFPAAMRRLDVAYQPLVLADALSMQKAQDDWFTSTVQVEVGANLRVVAFQEKMTN